MYVQTDKASLLAEVIEHVKELKRQTSLIAETSPIPTEVDEVSVDDASEQEMMMISNGSAKFVIKASLCCEDRSDLLPDLIKTLKSLRLTTLKAEITTLGGRLRNVLFVTADEEQQQQNISSIIQDALKAVIEKTAGDHDSSSANIKRQRTTTTNNINIL